MMRCEERANREQKRDDRAELDGNRGREEKGGGRENSIRFDENEPMRK